ncbi:MAG: radical SAM protein, partial [Deltaproteobacteria bacterium]|nr:radical SAM protein [Deltaproteobacteria bacterium]
TRPVSSVVSEIEAMLDRGHSHIIFFVDDNISGRPDYAKELFKSLVPLKIKWGSFASVAMTRDRELMDLARKSGCIELFIGFESIHQENLDASNKKWVRVDRMKEDIKVFHDYGIIVEGSFIFGHDHDTKDIFRRTVEFVQTSGIQVPVFGVLTPHPATRLRARLEKEGRLLPEASDW